jgi:antitoxin ParD1/3/4
MTTLNISLPEPLQEYIDGKVAECGYSTPSEYIRQLIEEDQQRSARQQIDALLIEGLESGAPIEITDGWRQRREAELLATLTEGQSS